MGGKSSKRRGTGYEYRIRDWFRKKGWQAERNPLSGASTQILTQMGKHDVRAWLNNSERTQQYFLQIEAKKTKQALHTIQWKWLQKIDFNNDELLVIAWQRTDHYALISWDQYLRLSKIEKLSLNGPTFTCEGESTFRLHYEQIEKITFDSPALLWWETYQKQFVIVPLESFVEKRLQLPHTRAYVEVESNPPPFSKSLQSDSADSSAAQINCPHCNKVIILRKN